MANSDDTITVRYAHSGSDNAQYCSFADEQAANSSATEAYRT